VKTLDLKFAAFSLGMGAAIASSLIFIYILTTSLMGKRSLVYEQNPIIAIGEIFLLTFSCATCILSTEIYIKYQKKNTNLE
jgi:hypothetical protein